MLRVITDFDGPIMDVSERYYHVYQLCLEQIKHPEQKVNRLSKDDFWQLKRSRTPEKQIALISGLEAHQAQEFAQLRRDTVHNLTYLAYDQIQDDAIATLETIRSYGANLLVMTMRKDKELEFAFQKYPDLQGFFPPQSCYCLANDYIKIADVKDKPLLMARALRELPPTQQTWMVGDTEADIAAAKTHQIKSIAVLSGIRDRNQLESHAPDFIVNNITEAWQIIRQES